MSNYSNYVPVERILEACYPDIFKKLQDLKNNLIKNTLEFVESNFSNLLLLAKGGEKAAVYKRKPGKCTKSVYDDEESDDSQSNDDELEFEEQGDEIDASPRNIFSTKKVKIFVSRTV